MYFKTAIMLGWFAGSYAFLVFGAETWWQAALGATSLALALAGVGFSIQHDANHDAYSRSRTVNRILGRTLDLLGASSYLWHWKHNIFHHTYTNVADADHDINLAPFARLTPLQELRRAHRFQHLYMWALYGFTVFRMHLVEGFITAKPGRPGVPHVPPLRGVRRLELFAAKLVVIGWAIVVPMLFHPWWVVLAFYAGTCFAAGVMLGIVFQIAHCHDAAPFPEPDPDSQHLDDAWAVHQVKTTANFAPNSRLITWYVGGLNYQIEHHLFPKVCHVHYPRLARIVREVCAEFDIGYTSYPSFGAAVLSHGRLLRRMGSSDEALISPLR